MRALTLMRCAFPLAILGLALSGCASSVPAPLPEVWWPTSLTSLGSSAPAPKAKAKRAAVKRIACPELSAGDVATLQETTARPKKWGPEPATVGELQAHVDALELGEASKAAAAKRVIAEHERCRGAGGKKAKPK